MNKCLLYILLSVILLCQNAESAIFREVKSPTATVYLLGSVHLADSTFYPLDSAIYNAFDASDYLVTEILLDDLGSVATKMQDKLYYPKGDSLSLHVSDTTYNKVLNYFESRGVGRRLVRRFTPSLVILMITQLEYMNAGFTQQYGIDVHFTKISGSKSILQLESADSQIDLISALDTGDPEKALNDAMDNMDNMLESIHGIADAWKSGDEKKLINLIDDEMRTDTQDAKELTESILDNRNSGMYKKIKEYLATDKTYFVIVGAAHLLGEKGIFKLLETDGYSIRK